MNNIIATKLFLATIALLLILAPVRAICAPIKTGKYVVLITPEEAAQPDEKPRKGMAKTEEPSDGPIVEFQAPTPGTEVQKPVPIKVSFKENAAPIDLESLEVDYLKLFAIDITDRIKPYVTIKGINVENAELPVGNHKVRFSIKDIEENVTERTLRISIIE